jgi:hypothetical protein
MDLPPISDESPVAIPVSAVASQPISWLWPRRLALGKLAMLDGDPDMGKSLLTLDLCARLSTGRPFPDGSLGPGVCNSLLLCTEDNLRDTIRPRLAALGANVDRVFVCEDAASIRLPVNLELLARAVRQIEARLVVIDPIMAFLEPRIHGGNDQSVRQALHPLAVLAERFACAVLLIRHLNKWIRGHYLYRGYGSIGFLGACRSGWIVAPDPLAPERRVLAQVKNNLAPAQPSLAFVMRPGPREQPVLEWLGASPYHASQLAGPCSGSLPTGELGRACDFLSEQLARGPRTTRELWSAARSQRLNERTLFRARNELEVTSEEHVSKGRRSTYWLLPGQKLRDVLPADPEVPDLEQWLAPLRERFPSPTPLDEEITPP